MEFKFHPILLIFSIAECLRKLFIAELLNHELVFPEEGYVLKFLALFQTMIEIEVMVSGT